MATTPSNVIRVPPRVTRVHHRGLHGRIEYHPATKRWTFTLKLLQRVLINGDAASLEEAKLRLKQKIDVALTSGGKNLSSED